MAPKRPLIVAAEIRRCLDSEFSQDNLDTLLYYLFDKSTSDALKQEIRDNLKSKIHDKVQNLSNRTICTESFCHRYGELRALGLPRRDIAMILDLSLHKLLSMLRGDGLSPKQHENLLRAEASGESELKKECLQAIKQQFYEKGGWKAAVVMLEKMWPNEYGKRAEVFMRNDGGLMGDNDCSNSAQKARIELEIIREQRAQENDADLYL